MSMLSPEELSRLSPAESLRRRHTGRGLEKAPPAHAQALRELHPRFELALLLRLRPGHEFVAGDRLHRKRRQELLAQPLKTVA